MDSKRVQFAVTDPTAADAPKPASAATRAVHQSVPEELPFSDQADFTQV